MKSTILLILLSVTTTLTFICSYFGNLVLDYSSQYFAVIAVAFLDGILGIIAGTKKEGFKTYKALKILKTTFAWLSILTVILMVEEGFVGTFWLSETIIMPFIVFQLISILKNAAQAGFIKGSLLNEILEKIDQHKNIK
jgi:phage-related holin